MNKNKEDFMENCLLTNYDSICYATFINIKTMASHSDKIAFINFNAKNKEHLFVLSVTMACWSILGEKLVTVDESRYRLKKLNKKYKNIGSINKTAKDEQNSIDVVELLNFMRKPAMTLCGDDFNFGDIYDTYYNRKEQ
jgi:hypothetical protein